MDGSLCTHVHIYAVGRVSWSQQIACGLVAHQFNRAVINVLLSTHRHLTSLRVCLQLLVIVTIDACLEGVMVSVL